jgi:hypothetical protein
MALYNIGYGPKCAEGLASSPRDSYKAAREKKRGNRQRMDEKVDYSEEEIKRIIGEADRDNFVLANAARMAYYAGFRENEILNIKIKHVLDDHGVLLPEIKPFLPPTREYTSMPIILREPAKSLLDNHIMTLRSSGYDTGGDTALFPDLKKWKAYVKRTLIDRFEKHFGGITITEFRRLGIERKEEQLWNELCDPYRVEKELLEFSRISRMSKLREFVDGAENKDGEPKKKDLPWERIVKGIENLTGVQDKYVRRNDTKKVKKRISEVRCNRTIKRSLHRLLKEYKSRLSTRIDVS